jgi:hypothetical protein
MSFSPQTGFMSPQRHRLLVSGIQASTSSSRRARTFGLDIKPRRYTAVWSPYMMVVAFALALVLARTLKVPVNCGEHLPRDFVG